MLWNKKSIFISFCESKKRKNRYLFSKNFYFCIIVIIYLLCIVTFSEVLSDRSSFTKNRKNMLFTKIREKIVYSN